MWEIFIFKSQAENETGKLVADLFLFFKKPLNKVKASSRLFSFKMIWQTST